MYVAGDRADVLLDNVLDAEEGKKYAAYGDPLTGGAPYTIGKGHTGPEVHLGLVWDDFQIEAAFQLDKASAWQGCYDHFEPWFRQLNFARQVVLVAMMFQMGVHRVLEFANTLAAVRDGHYALAGDGMRNSAWGRQTPGRVNRMAALMETGIE